MAKDKSKTIEFIGDQIIPEDRVFDWLQAGGMVDGEAQAADSQLVHDRPPHPSPLPPQTEGEGT